MVASVTKEPLGLLRGVLRTAVGCQKFISPFFPSISHVVLLAPLHFFMVGTATSGKREGFEASLEL